MSRFFGRGDDSDSSSSDSEGGYDRFRSSATSKTSARPSNFFQLSDDEEEQQRVVRSAKEKRYEQLHDIIRTIKNCKKTKDFYQMESSFLDLTKAYDKARAVIIKEDNGITPVFFVAILVEMEDLITEAWEDREGRKNMSKNNSKSLAAVRQRLRRYIRDQFETDVANYRTSFENASALDSDGSDGDNDIRDRSDDSDEEDKASGDLSGRNEDEDDDDDSWAGMSDDDSSSSSDDDVTPGMSLRERFLKKPTFGAGAETSKDDDEKRKRRERKVKKILFEDDADEDDGGWTTVEQRGAVERPKMFDKDAEINLDIVCRKLEELVIARSKRKTNRREQIQLMSELISVCQDRELGTGIELKIEMAIVAALLDYQAASTAAALAVGPATAIASLKAENWLKCLDAVDDLLDIVDQRMNDVCMFAFAPSAVSSGEIEAENLVSKPYKLNTSYLAIVESVDEEFRRVLKACDAHSVEYVDRLADETRVIKVLNQTLELLQRQETIHKKSVSNYAICRIRYRLIDHLYFKYEADVEKCQKNTDIIDEHCKYIYANDSTDRLRTRAILVQVYHHALHDRWFKARDLMLMSHLQDTIACADPETQIIYNRTMVQLGLCAFRRGEIQEAHTALQEIQQGGRSKELLAQGLLPLRYLERTTEQEKMEKQRHLPFHMHINLELIECVYLVASLLLEVPVMDCQTGSSRTQANRRMFSRALHGLLKTSERQALIAPPDSMRDHVAAAARALRQGLWVQCRDALINEKMNAKVWDLFPKSTEVKAMLADKIQEESIRAYLFTYGKIYDSISMEKLCSMFEMSVRRVDAVVSRLVMSGDLMASIDGPTGCVIMHRTNPTALHSLAMSLADRLAALVENNERILESRSNWQGVNAMGGGQWRLNSGNQLMGRQASLAGGGGAGSGLKNHRQSAGLQSRRSWNPASGNSASNSNFNSNQKSVHFGSVGQE